MPTFGGIGFGGGGVGKANFTNTPTGTYSSGGINYKYLSLGAGTHSLVIDKSGISDILLVGGGPGGSKGITGGSGTTTSGAAYAAVITDFFVEEGTYSIVVGSGGAGTTSSGGRGGSGTVSTAFGITAGLGERGLPGFQGTGGAQFTNDFTGSTVTYCVTNSNVTTNPGSSGALVGGAPGEASFPGSPGRFVIRVQV